MPVTGEGGLGDFRVLRENAWSDEVASCARVADAWTAMRQRLSLHRARERERERTASAPERKNQTRASLGRHTAQVLSMMRAAHLLPRMLVVLAADAQGPFTIWDGNHRAVALHAAAAESPGRRFPVQVLLGVSRRFLSPHRGSFYCGG